MELKGNQPEIGNGKLLMSRENPHGWKLEELLKKVAEEIQEKTKKLQLALAGDLADEVIRNNQKIEALLLESRSIQLSTMHRFDKLGPDQGPSKPRI